MAQPARFRYEAVEGADVLYHYLLLLSSAGVPFKDVADVLEKRRR